MEKATKVTFWKVLSSQRLAIMKGLNGFSTNHLTGALSQQLL